MIADLLLAPGDIHDKLITSDNDFELHALQKLWDAEHQEEYQ